MRNRVLASAAVVILLPIALAACAVGRTDTGAYVVGPTLSGGSAASDMATGTGSFLKALGVPGADAIGLAVGGILAALGIGVGASARSARKAADKAWDEATQQARLAALERDQAYDQGRSDATK